MARAIGSSASEAVTGAVRSTVDRLRDALVSLAEGWRGRREAAAHAVWALACGQLLDAEGSGLLVHATGTYLRDGSGCSTREAYELRRALAEASGCVLERATDERGPRARLHLRASREARLAAAEASLDLHRRGILREPLRGSGVEALDGETIDLGTLPPGRHTIRCPLHDDRDPSLHLLLRQDGTGGAACRASCCGARLAIRRSGSGRLTGYVTGASSSSTPPETTTGGSGGSEELAGGWSSGEWRERPDGLSVILRRRTGPDRPLWTRDVLSALREADRHAIATDEEDAWITVDAQDHGRDRTGRSRWRRGHVRWVLVDLDGETGPAGRGWVAGVAGAVREVLSGRVDLGPAAAPLLDGGRPWTGRAAIVRTSRGGLHVLAELRRGWTPDAIAPGGVLRPLVERLALGSEAAARAVGFEGATWDRACSGVATRRPGWRTLDDGTPWCVELSWAEGPAEALGVVPWRRYLRGGRSRAR